MTSAACPTCGTGHGPAQRYCLGCGALIGQRAVEIEQAIAFGHDRDNAREAVAAGSFAPAETPTPAAAAPSTPAASVGVWRRPATSIATVIALAAGVTAGFLTAPQGGTADNAPVARSGPAGTTTPSTAAAETTAAPPATDDAPADTADAEDDAETPASSDAAETPDAPGASPVPADATPQASDGADAPSSGKAKAPAAKRRAASSGKGGKKDDKRPGKKVASNLPKISHIWVIGIGAPVAPRDGGYLGEALLARATELPEYTPASTDPIAGAAALVSGQEPSADAKTITTQLTAAKRSWRVYAPGTPSCSDAPGVNPLLAFPSVTSASDCADAVAGFSALPDDLKSADATPAFSYLATDPTLDPAGLDDQLKQLVEPIRKSDAFKASGLIAIVPTAANPVAPTGALVLSPFAAGSTSIGTSFGPYSLLRTFADLLGLDRLGHAADEDVKGLGPDILAKD